MSSNPIGVFDSGVGGLSIARSIREQLPNESIIYIADQGHSPYGEKSADYLTSRAESITQFLLDQECKAIVVACNTATVNTLDHLRAKFDAPLIGVEPGIKPAVQRSKKGVVGVLATEQTIRSQPFKRFVKRFSHEAKIELQPCPKFVELVETGQLTSDLTYHVVREYVEPLLEQGADQIVLGCTHYPFLQTVISDVVSGRAAIVETSSPVARQLVKRLTTNEMLANDSSRPEYHFWSSGCTKQATFSISQLWGKVREVKHLNV